MTRTAIYDLFIDDERVYVGISQDPARRLKEHVASGLAPTSATQVIVRWFEDRAEAVAAERERIRALKPRLNLFHLCWPGPKGDDWMKAREGRGKRKGAPLRSSFPMDEGQLHLEEVIHHLRERVGDNLAEWCRANDFSRAFVYAVLRGDAEPSVKLCEAIGITREMIFWIEN